MIDRCGRRIKTGDIVMIPSNNDIEETTVQSVNGNTNMVRTELGVFHYYNCIKLCNKKL
jgi:hypothetical protein